MKNTRTVSAQIIYQVFYKKENLKRVLQNHANKELSPEQLSAIKSLCYESLRHYLYYEDLWLQKLDKKPKDKMVCVLLTQALVEFYELKKPQHAVVNESINTAKKLNKSWAKGLINSTLRKVLATDKFKSSNEAAIYKHPQWWIDKLKQDWPNDWKQILEANNKPPPLWVRCSQAIDKFNYKEIHRYIKSAYLIEAQNITQLEEFKSGRISVQDASAQLAAHILNPKDKERILDACAAPGGKTGHLLELNSSIELDALEYFPNRINKIQQNLDRLKQQANIILGDAKTPEKWFKGPLYDQILIDAPCSASGIIRRQSDIKYIRQKQDLTQICNEQAKILESISKLLKPNGRLLYVTCSVFPEENSQQIAKFLKSNSDFDEIKLKYNFAHICEFGVQILPSENNMDGFYYCLLEKN
jgi:16S rRNA (cytosine967-C5)-methyltransferase